VSGLEKFPRRERLSLKREFQRVFKSGDKQVGNNFICYRVRQPSSGRKLGMAVSRKVGPAIVRNRVKRYIRETYRTQRRNMIDDIHFVIVARPGCAKLDFHESKKELSKLFGLGEVFHD